MTYKEVQSGQESTFDAGYPGTGILALLQTGTVRQSGGDDQGNPQAHMSIISPCRNWHGVIS